MALAFPLPAGHDQEDEEADQGNEGHAAHNGTDYQCQFLRGRGLEGVEENDRYLLKKFLFQQKKAAKYENISVTKKPDLFSLQKEKKYKVPYGATI